MMRRPPTRIELKHEDIEEYDEIVKERKKAASVPPPPSVPFDPKRGAISPPKRKLTVAERIGLNK